MKYVHYILVILISFIIGITMYAYQKEWFIIIPQTIIMHENNESEQVYQQKEIQLLFFKHEKWHTEKIIVIWSQDTTQNIKTILNNWFMLLEDEQIIDKDIQLNSVIISPAKELFLSFNKDPFNKQDATYDKIMIIQGLLKSIYENKIPVQTVRFLVHHQTLQDDHLNFSISWPIAGFITT